MALIAIPNISEGRNEQRIASCVRAVSSAGVRVLDVHSDAVHNRSVLTTTGSDQDLVEGMSALATSLRYVDVSEHAGVHPRLGALDVCPFVPHCDDMQRAIVTARRTGETIASRERLPVFFYGEAARRPETRELPSLRSKGLEDLVRRVERGLQPDAGPHEIDPRRGVVCVGARGVLIAFNVWLRAGTDVAAAIARTVRTSSGGLPGVRALGLPRDDGTSQVSMNLIDPSKTSIDQVYEAVARAAERMGVRPFATELVGLVPERFMPAPDAQAARLLMAPGRSLESVLEG